MKGDGMSRLSDWRERRIEQAAARRGDFTPNIDAKYFALYVEFYRRKGKPIPEHGRCDMFHAVIGQMLYRARGFFIGALVVISALIVLGAIVLMVVARPNDSLLLGILVVAIAQFYCGLSFAYDSYVQFGLSPTKKVPEVSWIRRSPYVAIPVLGILTLPGFLVGWIAFGLYRLMCYVTELLCDIKIVSSSVLWFVNTKLFSSRKLSWIRPWVALLLLVYVGLHFVLSWMIVVSIAIAAIGVIVLVFMAASWAASTHKARHANAVSTVSLQKGSSPTKKSSIWTRRPLRWVYDVLALIGTWLKTAVWMICPNVKIPDEIRRSSGQY